MGEEIRVEKLGSALHCREQAVPPVKHTHGSGGAPPRLSVKSPVRLREAGALFSKTHMCRKGIISVQWPGPPFHITLEGGPGAMTHFTLHTGGSGRSVSKAGISRIPKWGQSRATLWISQWRPGGEWRSAPETVGGGRSGRRAGGAPRTPSSSPALPWTWTLPLKPVPFSQGSSPGDALGWSLGQRTVSFIYLPFLH